MEVSWDECRQFKVDCTDSEAGPAKMYKDFDNQEACLIYKRVKSENKRLRDNKTAV